MAGRGSHLIRPAWMTNENVSSRCVNGDKKLDNGSTAVVGITDEIKDGLDCNQDDSKKSNVERSFGRSRSLSDERSKKDKKSHRKKDHHKKKRHRDRRDSDDYSRQKRTRKREKSESRERTNQHYSSSRKSLLPTGVISMWDKTPDQLPDLKSAAMALPSHMIGKPGGVIPNFKETRHARRIYVGGIGNATNEEITTFFNSTILRGLGRQKDPDINFVQSVFLQAAKNYAFVELKSPEIATACMALDGIEFRGSPLRINRSAEYKAHLITYNEPVPVLDLMRENVPSKNEHIDEVAHSGSVSNSQVPSSIIIDGPNKLFVGGLPHHMRNSDIIELLESFGRLKALKVIREDDEKSKGYCFCEYMNAENTDRAIEGLNDLSIGIRKLKVRRSNPDSIVSVGQQSTFEMPKLEKPPTSVLILLNMVSKEELEDEGEYADIVEDIRDEVSKYGSIKSIEIPRPGELGDATPGLEKIYIEFSSPVEATAARFHLEGRTFAGKIVSCEFMDPMKYLKKEF